MMRLDRARRHDADVSRLTDVFADRAAAPATHEPVEDAWALYLSGQRLDGDLVIRRLRTLVEP